MISQKTGVREQTGNVEEKLKDIYELQTIHSEIDKIKTLRGELPLEVQDLEDEIAGLETRIGKFTDEVNELEGAVNKKKNEIADAQELIKKYETQQANVRNNREFDSLTKEVEYQTLEIQLCEKRIKEFSVRLQEAQVQLDESKKRFKKQELEEIIAETKKEEDALQDRADKISERIEERFLKAYKRIRENARNGLAVVTVQRDACGGCFNRIPPQRQLDIRSRKKIIVCEYCGRILVDDEIVKREE
jgi:predicted  nucleic acid-binding Zn-ribbon protein